MTETREKEITRILRNTTGYWKNLTEQELMDTLRWDEEEREIISGITGVSEQELKKYAFLRAQELAESSMENLCNDIIRKMNEKSFDDINLL